MREVFQDLENNRRDSDNLINYDNLDVDVDLLIDEVRLNPNPPKWLPEAVESYVSNSKYNLSVEDVVPSDMESEPHR